MQSKLFHFSESNNIEEFVPRPVQTPSKRPDGLEWLNGPLVWAIDSWHQPMYLFPRDCPRILLWRTDQTSAIDEERYFAKSEARMIAYVENKWLSRVKSAVLYRYELPRSSFNELHDAGMWVSEKAVIPTSQEKIINMAEKLEQENVELRAFDSLTPLKAAWKTSLHVSGIRLHNAVDWTD